MNRFNVTALTLILSVLAFYACQKSGGITAPASINVINAVDGSNRLIAVFGTTDKISFRNPLAPAGSIGYGNARLYSPLSGNNPLYIVPTSDTTKRIFSGSLDLVAGKIYSLFLCGDVTKADTMLIIDSIPVFNDSTTGIRFINLCPDAKAITINLEGNTPDQTEFGAFGYKSATRFRGYPADSNIPGYYNFEVRDAASGNLLTTYSWYYTLYRNNTLVLSGSADPSSSNPLQVFQLNNF